MSDYPTIEGLQARINDLEGRLAVAGMSNTELEAAIGAEALIDTRGPRIAELEAQLAGQVQTTVTAREALAHVVVERDAARVKLRELEEAHRQYAENLDTALHDAQLEIVDLENKLEQANSNNQALLEQMHRDLLAMLGKADVVHRSLDPEGKSKALRKVAELGAAVTARVATALGIADTDVLEVKLEAPKPS